MVDAVVSFAVQRLGDLLIEQVVFLRGVKDDVLWLRDKLDYLKCFLKDAEGKQDFEDFLIEQVVFLRGVKGRPPKREIEFLEKMKEDDLEPHLRDYLKVVLDDVWDANAWLSLMRAFSNENNGSRVILTT
ncbi:hypothetical protein Vadar_020792 [Vaccinium darrowii]|uniref:Uncharacterized protein n=1 Tax=Vaccinium darrowii TaxID=229202 RepID=A0ACB7YZ80_9ERIC|nr:hypothetical protein Vadar_020792 [Vaccinium darrowii]